MATTTNKEGYNLTEEQFKELSGWDYEIDSTFNCIILEYYKRTRECYESDKKWLDGEWKSLKLSIANFEVGYYKQAAKTAKEFLETSNQNCFNLTREVDRLKGELAMTQGELKACQRSRDELNKKYIDSLVSDGNFYKTKCDTLQQRLDNLLKAYANLNKEHQDVLDEVKSLRA